jgi:hypothetical protein
VRLEIANMFLRPSDTLSPPTGLLSFDSHQTSLLFERPPISTSGLHYKQL